MNNSDEELAAELDQMGPGARYKIYKAYLMSHPGSAWGWARLAYEAEDLGLLDEAKSYLERSIDIEPGSGHAAQVYYNLALMLENKFGDRQNARLNYMNAICAHPDYDLPYNNLALLLGTDGIDPGSAKDYFHDAIHRWPDDAGMLHNIGYFYARCLDDDEEAIMLLKRALELDPGNEDILYDLNVLESDSEAG